MTNVEFVANVKRIAERDPVYREGGDGSDGTCDCIGLVMGATGKEYPMHSTNYFARYEVGQLMELDENTDLTIGNLLFKARGQNNPRYDLNERYQYGGRYYVENNVLDYYHAGVVTNVNPLEITHCTSTNNINGIAYDATTDGWTHAAYLPDLTGKEEASVESVMRVYAENQKPVRMRKRPDTNAETIIKVPVGELVQVKEAADGWSKISYRNYTGYMMQEFLVQAGSAGNKVTIMLDPDVAAALAAALAEAEYTLMGGN